MQALFVVCRQRRVRQQRQHRIGHRLASVQVCGKAGAEIFELFDEHRREVDHRPCLRIGFEVRGHVDVVFDGVQISPGQYVLPGQCIPVVRLVHMPEQHHRQTTGTHGSPFKP